MKKRNYELEDEHKEMKILIKELKMKTIDETQYQSWDHEQILMWIMSLENGRYKQYHDKLKHELESGQVTGDDLNGMNELNDMKELGITIWKDKKALLSSIKQLQITNKKINNNNNNQNNINEGAPTAYIG